MDMIVLVLDDDSDPVLAQTLIMAVTDLLFCPDFTVSSENKVCF